MRSVERQGRLGGKDVDPLDSLEMSAIVGEERELVAQDSRAYQKVEIYDWGASDPKASTLTGEYAACLIV